MAERPTPAAVFARLQQAPADDLLRRADAVRRAAGEPRAAEARASSRLRRCTSAGEALPADIGKRWTEHFGVEILDGLGSTEMLHIFLSNRPGDVRYGTTGKPVPGYELRDRRRRRQAGRRRARSASCRSTARPAAMLLEQPREDAATPSRGRGRAAATSTRSTPTATTSTAGRTDDMLKVGGIYVSPFEVEAALITHPAVLEAAVVGTADDEELIKPKAYVVLKRGHAGDPTALAEELRQHVKAQLAPYKYPRWIEFIDELPKTATGKIQRFKLRAQARMRSDGTREARVPRAATTKPQEEIAMKRIRSIPAPRRRDRGGRGRGRRAAAAGPRWRRAGKIRVGLMLPYTGTYRGARQRDHQRLQARGRRRTAASSAGARSSTSRSTTNPTRPRRRTTPTS